MRAGQDRRQGVAHAAVEGLARLAAPVVEAHQRAQVRVGHRPAEGALGQVGDDLARAGLLVGRAGGLADEDHPPAGRVADARHLDRALDLEGVHRLHALLAAVDRIGAHALVALGVAAAQEGHRDLVLAGGGVEVDVAQPLVDLEHAVVELLVDQLVVFLAADVGAVELLAVEQGDDRVLELHLRHFAGQRHVADGQHIFAVGREHVLLDHAAARAERHAVLVLLLVAGALGGARGQGDDHVGDVAVGRVDRRRLGIAHGLQRQVAGGRQRLVEEVRRELQRRGVGVEIALQRVLGQPFGGIDVEADQVAHGIGVFAAVQAAQRHQRWIGRRARRLVELGLQEGDQLLALGLGRLLGAGGRHVVAAQATDRLFPDRRVVGVVAAVQAIQGDAADLGPSVVAADAVAVDHRDGRLRRRHRRLGLRRLVFGGLRERRQRPRRDERGRRHGQAHDQVTLQAASLATRKPAYDAPNVVPLIPHGGAGLGKQKSRSDAFCGEFRDLTACSGSSRPSPR